MFAVIAPIVAVISIFGVALTIIENSPLEEVFWSFIVLGKLPLTNIFLSFDALMLILFGAFWTYLSYRVYLYFTPVKPLTQDEIENLSV